MNAESVAREVPLSTFVTVLAWIFIVISGFGTVITILQNIMINTVFPLDQMHAAMAQGRARQNDMPALAGMFFDYIRVFFAAIAVLAVTTLISSIALLQRKNWARIVFICLFGLGIVWSIGGIVLQQFIFSWMPPMPPNAPPELRAQFAGMGTFMVVMRVFSAIFALAFVVLYGWLMKRLMSAAVKAEFTGIAAL